MRIEIDKKSGLVIGVIAVLFFALGIAVTGGNDRDGMMGWMRFGGSSTTDFSANDIMFAQMMIPHHQQAVTMSDLAFKNSTSPDVRALAKQIKGAQAPEIAQMKKWLSKAGATMLGAHGMTMDGMLSAKQLSSLAAAQGPAFDRLFLQSMITHHEGALAMISMISNSKNLEARTLAKNIEVSQSAEIELMKKLLASTR